MTDEKKKRSYLRRVLRGLKWALLLALVMSLASAYAPFAVQPELSPETAAIVEARADEMMRDQETGDRAMIIEQGADALDERIRLIQQAKREIVIVTYENHDGESTRDILAAALDRARAGVEVRFLVDGIFGRLDHMSADLFRAVARHPNVEVRFYNLVGLLTPWKDMGRMHDKYVIVDDLAYILGGRNMFDKFLGEYTPENRSLDREALICCTDPARTSLTQLRDYFEGMWSGENTTAFDASRHITDERCQAVWDELQQRLERLREIRPELFEPCDYEAKTVPTRGVWLVSNPTGIYAKEPVVFAQLTALMRRAEKDVTIHSPYALLNGYMSETLREIAARVPVTLMVNAVENGANLAANGDYLYHRDEVLSLGAAVLEYAGGKSYHGKAVAIDDQLSIIGSFNMDMRSAYIDTELMLVIRSPEINAELRRNMAVLHAECRDAGTGRMPPGLVIPDCPPWKRALLYVIGALLQPIRNLV